jgi:DNA-binding NtrC family response regulator
VRVLVVEDEPRMASLIRRGLTREGLAADVAGTGEDALWMSGAHEYDAIVKAIAEAHGGTANAANRAEGGADVWLELPKPEGNRYRKQQYARLCEPT